MVELDWGFFLGGGERLERKRRLSFTLNYLHLLAYLFQVNGLNVSRADNSLTIEELSTTMRYEFEKGKEGKT